MSRIHKWYTSLSKRVRDSIFISASLVGMISTVLSVLGVSLGDLNGASIWLRIGIVIATFFLLCVVVYVAIGKVFKNAVSLSIRQTDVVINCNDIFAADGFRVIGCDTHFDTRVDDIIIAKKSLHGQLVLEHGKKEDIEKAVEAEAVRLGLKKNRDGLYNFPLGTVIRYNSSIDNHTYLLLAMAELNSDYEVHTNMAQYELMLMKMWKEINRVYANNNISLPLLGAGIVRFDDGPKYKDALLRCMLCTLNSSGVTFNSKIEILIYGNSGDVQLYEYKDIFNVISRR